MAVKGSFNDIKKKKIGKLNEKFLEKKKGSLHLIEYFGKGITHLPSMIMHSSL